MDTRFWGPSGWKLLHAIAFTYEYSSESSILYSKFFETLPFILPCKYCRFSLIDYYKLHPFQISTGPYDTGNERAFLNGRGVMNPQLDVSKWMFTIHNCVNDKLRKQELHKDPNPTYADVKYRYASWSKEPWQTQLLQYWDFLFAVGYNHPKSTHRDSTPMPDCPSGIRRSNDTCERTKWNILSLKDKTTWYHRFWTFLPVVLPAPIAMQWQRVEKENPPTLESRKAVLAWLWRMRCALDTSFKDPYSTICKKIARYSSDCGKAKSGITCRKKRGTLVKRSTLVKRQRKTISRRK